MGQPIQPALLQVVKREGNRCTASFICGLCDEHLAVVFHEGEATNLLDGPLLWVNHFSSCPKVTTEPIGIRIILDPSKEGENYELDPATRELRRKS